MQPRFIKELRIIQEVQRIGDNSTLSYLTINHLQLLLTIFDMETEEGLEAQHLASVTGHNKSTVNRIVHSLGEKRGRGNDKSAGLGLIEVANDPHDDRIRRIHVTPYGKRLKKILFEAAGDEDAEATALSAHMQAVMFQSKSNVVEAKAATKINTTVKVKGVVAGKAEVGTATVKVTGQDATLNATNRSLIKEPAALERAIRTASAKGYPTIRFRGQEIALIDIESAQEAVKEGKLHKGLVYGMWGYHNDVVWTDYGTLPKFFQADLTTHELNSYADRLLQNIISSETDVSEVLGSVGEILNAHQRKWVVNHVVKGLGKQREHALEVSNRLIADSELDSNIVESLMDAAKNKMAASEQADDLDDGEHLFREARKDLARASEVNQETSKKLEFADVERKKAAKMEAIEQQLASLAGMLNELKND